MAGAEETGQVAQTDRKQSTRGTLLLSSISPCMQSYIPVREWCHPLWEGLYTSLSKLKNLLLTMKHQEAHLPHESRHCEVDN